MLGVNQIINISAPILEVLYPCTMTIVLLGLFNEKIKDDIVFKIPSLVSLIFGFLFVLQEKELLGKFGQTLESFPLQQFGLGWVFPMLIGLLVSIIIAKSKEL